MFDLLQAALAPLAATLGLFAQMTSLKLAPKMGLLKSIFIGVFLGGLAVIVLEYGLAVLGPAGWPDFWGVLAVNMIFYFALSYCLFNFINMGETARRVRILREFYDAPQGLCAQELLQRYSPREIITRRIDRLLGNGQLVSRNGRYYIGRPLMLWMAEFVVMVKLILLGKKSEFEE